MKMIMNKNDESLYTDGDPAKRTYSAFILRPLIHHT